MSNPDLSESLQAFVAEAPVMREPHITFLQKAASRLEPGARVLDVGAGDSPYRELFDGLDYTTTDWDQSIYDPTTPPDITAPADNIPLPDESLDAIVCTQVLEHVAEPGPVLSEFYRLIVPGGHLFVTTPFVWYLHEQPHDYYRYTSHGLHYLATRAGFTDITVSPMSDSLSTIAQMTEHLGYLMGTLDDGFQTQREIVAVTMQEVSALIRRFGNFDTRWMLPISYSLEAIRPGHTALLTG